MIKICIFTVVIMIVISCGFTRVKGGDMLTGIYDYTKALDDKDKYFLLLKDSTRILYDGLKIKTPLFLAIKFVINGDTTISSKDVIAYQTADAYFTTTYKCGWTTRRTAIARISTYIGQYETGRVEAVRDMNGKYEGTRDNRRTVYQSYIQKDNGKLVEFDSDNLYEMVKKHKPSVAFIDIYNENYARLKRKPFAIKKKIKNQANLGLALDEFNKNYKGK